jgi:hypothetical protein
MCLTRSMSNSPTQPQPGDNDSLDANDDFSPKKLRTSAHDVPPHLQSSALIRLIFMERSRTRVTPLSPFKRWVGFQSSSFSYALTDPRIGNGVSIRRSNNRPRSSVCYVRAAYGSTCWARLRQGAGQARRAGGRFGLTLALKLTQASSIRQNVRSN